MKEREFRDPTCNDRIWRNVENLRRERIGRNVVSKEEREFKETERT